MNRDTRAEEAKALAKEFSTPARELKSVQGGEKIAEPLLFEPTNYFHHFNELKLQSALRPLLKAAIESKEMTSFEDLLTQACQDLNINKEWATKYFDSPRYKRWYADRMKEIEAHQGISIEYLAHKHKANLEGEIRLTSSQLDSAKELGDRFWPKISRIEHEISRKESVTLDDLPDYAKKVEELENKLKGSITVESDAA